ncbi:MAG TPA: SurA N-terminal domain-containing protein [Candidatus Azoamicus sp.]
MNIKNTSTWIIIILLSLSLTLTTLTNPSQKETQNIIKIDSFIISKNEIENILTKIKNTYPEIKKIENINSFLEKKIINHITSNIKIKKLGLNCEEKEIIYLIKKSKIFQKNNTFSKEKYKKYLENQKINEHIIQKNIKRLSELKKINTLTRNINNKELNLDFLNKKYTYLEKVKYKAIYKNNLIKNTKIKKNFIKFEKNYIKNYKIPQLYKIQFTNIHNKENKKILISQNDINKKIFNLINKNNKISIKNKHGAYLIKKISKINQKIDKTTYKKDLLTKYKELETKKFIKKHTKTTKNKIKEKIIFISPKSKKNYTSTKIKKQNIIKNKNGIIIKNTKDKKITILNTKIQNDLINHIENKKYKLKNILIDKNTYQ